MCGRFTLTTKSFESLIGPMRISVPKKLQEQYKPRYNIAPSNSHWILVDEDGKLQMQQAVWGYVPKWSKDGKGWINARIETIAEKPAFRTAYKNTRCLIPTDGFFEWYGNKPPKQPYWFTRRNHEPFLFAGIYGDYETKDSGKVRTFGILTKAAEGSIKEIHDRMPVAFTMEDAPHWLTKPEDYKKYALFDFEKVAVSKDVNSPRNDSPNCIKPV